MHVRRATDADVREIARVQVEGWQQGYKGVVDDAFLDRLSVDEKAKNWADWIHAEGNVVLIASTRDTPDTIDGFLSFGPVRTRFPGDKGVIASVPGEVYALYVSPNSWRSGVGRALMAELPALCREKRYGAFGLWALNGNTRAHAFYTAMGGTKGGKKDALVGDQKLQETAFIWRDLRKLASQ